MIALDFFALVLLLGGLVGVPLGVALGFRWGEARKALAVSGVLLLLLAAAGLITPGSRDATDVLVVDLSFSTGPRRVPVAAIARRESLSPERTAVVFFGQTAIRLPRGEKWPNPGRDERRMVGAGGSALASALRLAAEITRPGSRVVVVTDGRAPLEGVAGAAAAVRSREASVHVVPFGAVAGGDARILSLRVPGRVARGAKVVVDVGIAGTEGRPLTVVLDLDGREAASRAVAAGPGGRASIRFALAAPGPGYHEIDARLKEDAEDPCPENDRLASGLVVEGRPRVLLVDIPRPAKVPADGWDRRYATSEAIPSPEPFDLIVLRDVPVSSLPGLGSRLCDWVRSGGGLVVAGGRDSFGVGGYGGRPLEACLPVRCSPGGSGLLVVVLLDHSGTMGEPFSRTGGRSKLAAAAKAVRRLVQTVAPGTTFALIPFSKTVTGEVVPLVIRGARERVRAGEAVDSVPRAAGPTSLQAPLRKALEVVRATRAAKALVLGVTDGKVPGDDPSRLEDLAELLRAAGTSIRFLAVGRDADLDLLGRLAGGAHGVTRVGGGGEIAAAFLGELFRTEGKGLVLEREFRVRAGPGGQNPLRGDPPPVSGLVRTWPRPGSLLWEQADGGLPVVAAWRYGLGRVVAVTTDPWGPWAARWRGEETAGALLRWALRPPGLAGLRVEAGADAAGLSLRVRAPVSEARARGVLFGPGRRGIPVELPARGGGLYAGRVGRVPPGAWRLRLALGDRVFDGGLSVPYPGEYRETGLSASGIERLRKVVGEGPRSGRSGRDMSWLPALLALLVLVISRIPFSSRLKRPVALRR